MYLLIFNNIWSTAFNQVILKTPALVVSVKLRSPAGHRGSRSHRWSDSPGWSPRTSGADRSPSPPARSRRGTRSAPACRRETRWSRSPAQVQQVKHRASSEEHRRSFSTVSPELPGRWPAPLTSGPHTGSRRRSRRRCRRWPASGRVRSIAPAPPAEQHSV